MPSSSVKMRPTSDGGQHGRLCRLFGAQRTDGLSMKTRADHLHPLPLYRSRHLLCHGASGSFTNHLSSVFASCFLLCIRIDWINRCDASGMLLLSRRRKATSACLWLFSLFGGMFCASAAVDSAGDDKWAAIALDSDCSK